MAKLGLTNTSYSLDMNDPHTVELRQADGQYVVPNDPVATKANLEQGIEQKATELQKGLAGTKATATKSQLQGAFNQIEDDPNLISEPGMQKKADLMEQYALKQFGNGGGLDDLIQVRKDLDAYVKKYYPNIDSNPSLSPVKEAWLTRRTAINNLIDSRLPNGNLPDGTSFKQSLRNQSLMFEGIENLPQAKAGQVINQGLLPKLAKPIRQIPGMGVAAEIFKH
jgi:hypothetical protein